MRRSRAERVDARTTRRANRVATRFEGRAERAEAHGKTGKADVIRAKGRNRIGKIDKKRQRFGLDPLTGRPTEGNEPAAVTDPAGNVVNIFVTNPDAGGAPQGSMIPQAPQHTVNDRTKVDLANNF